MRILIGGILVVAVLSSACLDGNSSGYALGAPGVGDSFHYSGSDGTNITVTVLGYGIATDASMVTHNTIDLHYAVHPASIPNRTIDVVEQIDLSLGLSVRQILLCVYNAIIECDPELDKVFYGMSGLPGALGAGPLWHSEELRAVDSVETFSVYHDLWSLDVQVDTVSEKCLWFRYSRDTERESFLSRGAWFPTNVLFEPSKFCDGIPLPTVWRPTTAFSPYISEDPRPSFYLQTWVRGSGEEVVSQGDHDWAGSGPVEVGGWPNGFFLPEEPPQIKITSLEAHGVAVELDAVFAEAASEGHKVVFNEYQEGGGQYFRLVDIDEDWYARTLGIQTGNDSEYHVTVLKKVRSVNGSFLSQEYDIIRREWKASHSVQQDLFSRPTAEIGKIIALGGENVKMVTYTFQEPYLDPTMPILESPYAPGGYEISLVSFPNGDESDEPGIAIGFNTAFDGATGALVRASVAPEVLRAELERDAP